MQSNDTFFEKYDSTLRWTLFLTGAGLSVRTSVKYLSGGL